MATQRCSLVFVALGNIAFMVIAIFIPSAIADEPRAPAPQFSESDIRGIFFDKIEDAFRGERPTLSSLRKTPPLSSAATVGPASDEAKAGAVANDWSQLISPFSLEDEVKRVRLHFDGTITTPGAFNGGGFQQARLDLSILTVLFAVIDLHGGEVRWKDEAAAARDLLARSAFNCKAGSTQVFNEAKLRKADLQDLVSGSGFDVRESQELSDWSTIVDRSPMMEYAEAILDSLKSVANDEATAKSKSDQIRREAELLALIGNVLIQSGMDDAEDSDYVKLSRMLISSASEIPASLDREDFDAVRKSVGAITQSCDACHEQYR